MYLNSVKDKFLSFNSCFSLSERYNQSIDILNNFIYRPYFYFDGAIIGASSR